MHACLRPAVKAAVVCGNKGAVHARTMLPRWRLSQVVLYMRLRTVLSTARVMRPAAAC